MTYRAEMLQAGRWRLSCGRGEVIGVMSWGEALEIARRDAAGLAGRSVVLVARKPGAWCGRRAIPLREGPG